MPSFKFPGQCLFISVWGIITKRSFCSKTFEYISGHIWQSLCLRQCLTSTTSTVTLTALARCRWSSRRGWECLKSTVCLWFSPNSGWSTTVSVIKLTRSITYRIKGSLCEFKDVADTRFSLFRYWGRLGVYGGAATARSTVIQGNTLRVSVFVGASGEIPVGYWWLFSL